MQKIQQMLSAMGVQQSQVGNDIEAVEFEWDKPHCFNQQQLDVVNEIAKNTASVIAERLGQFFQSSLDVSVALVNQHYAGKFISGLFGNDSRDYYHLLKTDKDLAVAMTIIPQDTTSYWLTSLLGETEKSDETTKQLSQLEMSLLSDAAFCFSRAIINANQNLKLKATNKILCDHFNLDLKDAEELCQISFEIKKAQAEKSCTAHFLLPCSKLLDAMGIQSTQQKLTPAQARGAMLNHINKLPVIVTTQLADTEFTFEQILTLQKGDILVLNKKISDPVELIIEGKTRFLGHPAQSGGKLAVQITQSNPKTQ